MAFQKADVPMSFRMNAPQEAADEGWKFTTNNGGSSILIRNFDDPAEWMP